MALAVATTIKTLAICFPIGDAIDRVRIRLVGGLLQSAPNKIPDVVIERLDFTLHRKLGILGGEVRRLAKAGVVAGHLINAPTLNAVVVVGTEQDFRIHVPIGD